MEANMGLTEWLNYFFVQGRSPANLLCRSSRASRRENNIRIGGFSVSVPTPSEDANRRRLQVDQRASRRKIVGTRPRLPRELGTARDNRRDARVC
jgi:hypothetical protein